MIINFHAALIRQARNFARPISTEGGQDESIKKNGVYSMG